MANVLINKLTGIIEIDGVSHAVDLSDLDTDIEQVTFKTDTRTGTIVYSNGEVSQIGMTRYFAFGKFVNRWKALQAPIVISDEEQKLIMIDQINSQRESTLAEGLLWNGKRWHTDTVFQSQVTAYVSAYGTGLLAPTATVQIRGLDNSNNTLTRLELFQLAGALMIFVGSAFAASWAAKDAL